MGTITIVGVDVTNLEDIDRTVGVLRSLNQRAKARGTHDDVLVEFDNGVAMVEFVSPDEAPESTVQLVGLVYGKKTREFLDRMVTTIRSNGGVTLEEAAEQHGIGIETARAFIRNAGRTAKAHGAALPVKPTWDHDRGCNVYTTA